MTKHGASWLPNVIKDNNICNQMKMLKMIQDRSINYNYIDHTILGGDPECRLYNEEFNYKEAIIDLSAGKRNFIYLNVSRSIHLSDLIIIGDLKIGGDIRQPQSKCKIFIDSMIILGKIQISGTNGYSNIEIGRVSGKQLQFFNTHIDKMFISSCSFADVEIEELITDSTYLFNNDIKYLSVDSISHMNGLRASFNRIDLERTTDYLNKSKRNQFISNYDPCHEYYTRQKPRGLNLDIELHERATVVSTLKFISADASHLSGKFSAGIAKASIEKLASISLFKKIIYWHMLGGFKNPFKVILFSFSLMLVFALLYTEPYMEFIVANHTVHGLTLSESLYYSGITITTIGYGDIAPVGFSRFIAVLEGFCGIISASLIVVSLVNYFSSGE